MIRETIASHPHGSRLLFRTAVLAAMLEGFLACSGGVMAEPLQYPVVFVQESVHDDGTIQTAQASARRIALLHPDGSVVVLSHGFAAAADPCVSFDAKNILFAGKRRIEDPWDIWEMEADGSNPTRITRDMGDCRDPIYLPRVAVDAPGFEHKVRWITFTSAAPSAFNDQGDGALLSLYAMNLEPVPGRGTVLWRTTYNLGGDTGPTLLSDGRVLFAARQRGAFALMTMSWSGENLNPFYGSHDGFVSQGAANELLDRTVLFIEYEGTSLDGSGSLARVSMRRPLRSHESLSAANERYRTPHALPDGTALVSYLDSHPKTQSASYGIYRFEPQRATRDLAIYDDPEWHDVDAMPVVPRREPPGRIPTVDFASVLDVGEIRNVGQLQCLNVYESDDRDSASIERGQVRAVRLIEGVPLALRETTARGADPQGSTIGAATASPDSTWPPPGVRTRILGEARVEDDGSFYVNVAGDVPFYIETLDSEGRSLRTMRAWTWVRAGDQRGCIGCHEDKELAPENRATQALIRARPATLMQRADEPGQPSSQAKD